MKKLHHTIAFSVLVAGSLILQSCTKEGATGPAGSQGTTGPTGPSGPSLTGTLAGYVSLFDQYGVKQLVSLDSSIVTIDVPHDTAYTDSTGKYQFQNLTTGVYNLSYRKSGYGDDYVSSQQFTGGGVFYHADIHLSAIPNFNIIGIRDSLTATDAFIIDSVTADSKARSLIVFIGASASVSSNPANYLNFQTKNINVNAIKSIVDIPFTDLQNLGFVSGQTVYVAAYGICNNFSTSSSYEDFSTGRTVFTAVSLVRASTSFILP